ncbi:MAG: Helix-turn-helix domain [Solirubrobacteraceae bacterium]|jgi:transcriptional regulator with XRE-family HTH domain|nr:Helix-turn-helix domain [Solirubrobacteraceae bacterium]MEA2151916.1 Helix-turn-helix domain [Solirubrobacteraceae bacterium]MEA2225857.1 Helix-turn-helix domain [Solirubrobacteraceae bacterium]MEA2334939.1 Helix-turn-helix domain [Solirubrobacteraceae bacterium]
MHTTQATRKQFAANLRDHRKRAGLTQEELAYACDLHPTAVGKLECRKRTPRLDTVVALSRALGLKSACELIEGIR